MSLLNGKWIDVFRSGNYGDKGNYTEADLDKVVQNFTPAQHEPPVVVGHPENNAPAFGWVSALKRMGNTLFAMFKDVPAEFEELVRSGRFKKRSVSFYQTADGPVLRHVGFLGAMPPEVKGLADVKFRDGQFQAIEFNEESDMENGDVKGLKKAMKRLTAFFEKAETTDAAPDFKKEFAEALKPFETKIGELQTQLAGEKTERDKLAAALADQGRASVADTQIKRVKDAGRWVPAFDKMGLPQVFSELAKSPTKVSFGEGDKKQEKQIVEVFADFMLALPKIVPVKAISTGGEFQERRSGKVIQFTEPNDGRTAVIEGSIEMAEAATDLAAKNNIPYGEALKIVRRTGRFAPAGGAAAGAV